MSETGTVDLLTQINDGLAKSPNLLGLLTGSIKKLDGNPDIHSFNLTEGGLDLKEKEFYLTYNTIYTNRQIEDVSLIGYERELKPKDLILLTAVCVFNREYANETGNTPMKPRVFTKTTSDTNGSMFKSEVLDRIWQDSEKLVVTKK